MPLHVGSHGEEAAVGAALCAAVADGAFGSIAEASAALVLQQWSLVVHYPCTRAKLYNVCLDQENHTAMKHIGNIKRFAMRQIEDLSREISGTKFMPEKYRRTVV